MKILSCTATQNRGISALDNQAYRTGAFRQSLEDGVSSTQLWSTSIPWKRGRSTDQRRGTRSSMRLVSGLVWWTMVIARHMNLNWMISWTARWSLPYCKSHESHLKAENNWVDARLDKPQNGACRIADSPYWNGWDSCIIDGEQMRLSRMSSSRRLKLIASTKDVKWSHPKHYPVWKPMWLSENELTDFPSCTISCWIRSWTPGT